jgi:hypothetical protein
VRVAERIVTQQVALDLEFVKASHRLPRPRLHRALLSGCTGMAPAHTLVAAVPADAVMELSVAAIPDQWAITQSKTVQTPRARSVSAGPVFGNVPRATLLG